MKFGRRIAAICSVAVLSVGAACMFTGCTSKHPEITITYEFNKKQYKVEYTLSRLDAPQTVQHFIELADAGYYDNTVIHNYDGNTTDGALYGGGFTLNETGDNIVAKNYFEELPRLEKEKKMKFTQSVWMMTEGHAPLYTVYGEFLANAYEYGGKEYKHSYGALVMYYNAEMEFTGSVRTIRNDEGKNNDGEGPYDTKLYKFNSATSLFYTYLGNSTSPDSQYAVFGKVKDRAKLDALVDDIKTFVGELPEEDSFTEVTVKLESESFDYLDHAADFFDGEVRDFFAKVRSDGGETNYNTPIDTPIIIKSVKVNKY